MAEFLRKLLPFIFIGVLLVAFAFGLMLLFYLFAIGALVGIILFIISWIKEKFFTTHKTPKPIEKRGRTIDSNDWKKM